MYITWEEAKVKYKGSWVVFKNPEYADKFHMNLIGGEFIGTTSTQSEMFNLIEATEASDSDRFTGKHTEEDEAVGTLMSNI